MDYTQCAASARDLSNAITRHKPRATWGLSMTLSALKSLWNTPQVLTRGLSMTRLSDWQWVWGIQIHELYLLFTIWEVSWTTLFSNKVNIHSKVNHIFMILNTFLPDKLISINSLNPNAPNWNGVQFYIVPDVQRRLPGQSAIALYDVCLQHARHCSNTHFRPLGLAHLAHFSYFWAEKKNNF